MSSVFGSNIKLSLFGESHSPYIGATISNLPAGLKVNINSIKKELDKRRPGINGETSRVEEDNFEIISGVTNNVTNGSPFTIIIPNKDVQASDYKDLENVFRPSHADYVSYIKYGRKSNGGGQFSGRMTAALVAINAILLDALKEKGIAIGSYVKQVGNIIDETEIGDINGTINRLNSDFFPTLDGQIKNKMISLIDEARNNGDSIGGKITTIVYNLIPGVGEPFFDSLESTISHAMFSIPAVKGITFGLGQSFAESYGSKVNDEFILKDCLIKTKTNFNGGINGGISNGMPIIFECIVKPTPSISLKQKTLTTKCEEVEIAINGRHDACLVRRIIPVINGLTAFVIFDNLLSVLGAKFFE